MRTHYVLGFIFDSSSQRVLLIRKRRPAWQAGKLNGVGGKIELGETPLEALVREVREEAALDTAADPWRYFGLMAGPDFEVHCYEIRTERISEFQALTDESLELVPVDMSFIAQEGQQGLVRLVAAALDREGPFIYF